MVKPGDNWSKAVTEALYGHTRSYYITGRQRGFKGSHQVTFGLRQSKRIYMVTPGHTWSHPVKEANLVTIGHRR